MAFIFLPPRIDNDGKYLTLQIGVKLWSAVNASPRNTIGPIVGYDVAERGVAKKFIGHTIEDLFISAQGDLDFNGWYSTDVRFKPHSVDAARAHAMSKTFKLLDKVNGRPLSCEASADPNHIIKTVAKALDIHDIAKPLGAYSLYDETKWDFVSVDCMPYMIKEELRRLGIKSEAAA